MTFDFVPMKAADLKGEIAWGQSDPFKGLGRYLNDAWVMEPKLDGGRFYLELGETSNVIGTPAYDYPDNFPHLRDLVVPEMAGTVLDGELMWKGGMPTGLALSNPEKAVATQQATEWATFMAFDVLRVKGDDVSGLPYGIRRELLALIVERMASDSIKLVPQLPATADSIQSCLDAGLEGVMLKKVSSKVIPGARASTWLKIKRYSTGDFYIIGSKPGKGKNEGMVGSLQVAYRHEGEDVYCADVRGFSDAFCREVTDPATGGVKAEWKGKVIEVIAQEATVHGRLRHPSFVRTRPDKTRDDCDESQIKLFFRGGS